MARAPQAIWNLWYAIEREIPKALLAGIVGDSQHGFGYHLARNELPPTDYSVTLPHDRKGKADAASALDVSLPPDLMIACTKRLVAAARAGDPRLRALREFCGTTDGRRTHPFDLSNGQDGPLDSWDSSHLTHIHLSFYREFADDTAALLPIAEVLAGATPDPLEELMALDPDSAEYKRLVADIADAVWKKKLVLAGSDETLAASRILARDYATDQRDAEQDAKP